MQTQIKKRGRNKINLALDSAIFVAFLVSMAPRFSGLAIHEWLGIAFGAAIVTHLLLHWQWIVEVTRRFLRQTQWSARINYSVNALLFIDITVIIFTGLMISKVALPLVGVPVAAGGVWRPLHTRAADLSVYLIGAHVALHWQWIVTTVKRYALTPFRHGRRAPSLGHTPQPAPQEV